MDVKALQDALGHEFRSKDLLQQALTHRSHSVAHNERLEFLGDSVLNCVVASLLFDKFVKIDEGDLSRLRANLVKQQSLYEIAQRLELSPHLRLGEGELKSGGFRRPSILADTVEALFGAIFLDAGFDVARRAIAKLYQPVLETVDPRTLGKDSKTLLQEYLQGRKIALPVYTVVATHGAAHSQEFEVECAVPKLAIQVLGGGGSRRAAEQAAAKKALEAAQLLAVAATKKTRRVKPAQLSLAVAVEQSAERPSTPGIPAPSSSSRKPAEVRPRDGEASRAVVGRPVAIEPARIVAQPGARPGAEASVAGKVDGRAIERREARAEVRVESKPDGKPDAKVDPKPDVKLDVKPDAKLDVKPDAKVDVKPDVKPDPQSGAVDSPPVAAAIESSRADADLFTSADAGDLPVEGQVRVA